MSANTTASSLHVLVAGGGIAGNAVALQLLRAGARVTVVERAAEPRPGGQAVDLRSASKVVAERMGLLPAIAKVQLDEKGMCWVDRDGRVFAGASMEDMDGKGIVADIEITRGDLNRVLLDAVAEAGGALDYRYSDWVQTLEQDDSGVDVGFASGRTGRYDLVVAADGVHSATRNLAYGPGAETFLGGYMAFFTMPSPVGSDIRPGWFAMHTIPSASFAIRPDHDPATSKAIITMRTDQRPELRRDVEAQKELIRGALTGAGWRAAEVLAAMDSTPDFYFDELDRIDVDSLSRGRVVLVGDSGYCGSPLTGMGTAMAFVGAYILAGEIASTPDDLAGALTRYEEKVTPFLAKAKELPGGGLKIMLPKSKALVAMARWNLKLMFSRLMRPVAVKMFFSATDDFELPNY
ncbi:FAD-dependent monooxygenase [Nocardia stercoris]|uniref:FAD-binding monooxygenase n=1 Tax=Nocardia stercoris TaxID=2483361 RepID=A0A3M2L9Q8_9NOCA|nr:FAD-dependent monooxygenase [Nocardia stercoris]RMI34321.1 FAD-binding monooxygenase [Nocardia stercoris]